MKVKIDIDGLSDAVQEELKNWQKDTCNPVLNEAYKAGAEEGKKVLLQGGPYKERTGKYTKDWDVTQRDSRAGRITGTESYSVHNKKHYQLTHLLQNGHASRNGGRVKAYPHIDGAGGKEEKRGTDQNRGKIRGGKDDESRKNEKKNSDTASAAQENTGSKRGKDRAPISR